MSGPNVTNNTDFVYKFNNEGFFGFSLTQDFYEWSFWHFLPILILIAGIYLVYRYREKIASWKGEETLRFIIAAVIILNEGFYYWRTLYVGDNGSQDMDQLLTKLPFQVCEWMAYFSAFMLMKKSRNLFDVCYYVCLTLGIIPYFMPSVIKYTGPAYARYYQFWLEHTLPVFAVFYMMFVHGFRADYKKVYKPFGVMAILAVFAIILNTNIEGANFLYLAQGTDGDSLANILPQNIWVRLVLYTGILIVLFALVSLPQIIPQIKAYRKNKKATVCACEVSATQTGTIEEKEQNLSTCFQSPVENENVNKKE